jgi:hypothetical protein
MKKLLNLFIILLAVVIIGSCTKDFDEMNQNPKALTLDNLDQASYGFVFRKAITGVQYLEPYGGTMQILHSLFFDIYANYFATTAPNFLSDRYVMVGSWLDSDWEGFYANEAPQIKYAEDFARKIDIKPELAMVKIWKVYAYDRYTDALGPIMYSQFGNMQKTVAYDSQEDIYHNFFLELDTAIGILKENAGGISATLSSYDPMYAGNLDKWQRFGSSLRLRLAMRCKYVDPVLAKTQAEKAVAEGVMTDNTDNGWVTTSVDFQNPYNIISPWVEYRMSADMESILKGYGDPRVTKYYSPAVTPDAADDIAGVAFPYEGIRNGQRKSDKNTVINAMSSDMAQPFTVVGGAGPNWYVMRSFESYLLRAEGLLYGWNMGAGTAQTLYEEGIRKSLAENGFTDRNLHGETYTTSARVPASAGVDMNSVQGTPPHAIPAVSTAPVAFRAAGTEEQQLEQIITQKWIGLWPDSQEAYAERRRTHYPVLLPRLESENPDVPVTSLPVRLTYGTTEYTNNTAELEKAIQMLNTESTSPNGDKATTKLWWDKKP